MHGNRELLVLLENGYDKAVADEIRKLVKVLDDNEALAAEFDPVADSYAADPDGPISAPLEKIREIGEKYGINVCQRPDGKEGVSAGFGCALRHQRIRVQQPH